MSEWHPLDWIFAYFGIAGFGMWLLDRSHRTAFAKLSTLYDKQLEHQAVLIDVLSLALATIREQRFHHDREGKAADES